MASGIGTGVARKMPERRFRYVELAREAGLPEPDPETMHLLWQIVDEGVLGASRHVGLVFRLLVHLADPDARTEDVARRLKLCASFLSETRGRDAPVVANAIVWLLDGLSVEDRGVKLQLEERAERWTADARKRQHNLVDKAIELLPSVGSFITFDYSSTVAAIVIELKRRGFQPRAIVPESRAIAGGRRYVEEFLAAGIDTWYVLDVAIDRALESADGVLLGCESLRCDGSLTNTLGSLPLAKLARLRGVPVYGCADLYKLDVRSYAGEFREPATRTFDDLLLADLTISGSNRVDTTGVELEVVPPELVTAFLTELGPITPAGIGAAGRKVLAEAPQAGQEAHS